LILKADTADPTQFNGTGPFVVSNYSPEDRIEFIANENYFVEGQPLLAGFEIIFFADDTAMADALRGGQVDLMMRIPTPLFESLKSEASLTTISIPSNSFDLIRLRADREPGNKPEVIQALKLATDREAAFLQVEQGFGAVGRDIPIGPLYTQFYSEDTPIPARDVEQARQLLAEAGYPDGLQIDLHTTDTGNRRDLAVVLKEQWAEAGIDVNVIVEPESVYFAENGWLEVDLGITNWGTRPYPQFYLDTMIKCDAVWNEAHYCDEELDQLIETAGTTLDEAERVQAYQDIQRILIERAPLIITSFWAMNSAVSNAFQDFAPKAFAGRTDLRTVSAAP
jgi:peptide/nickel transport system substrate-binding protein